MQIGIICNTLEEVTYIIDSFYKNYVVLDVSGTARLPDFGKYFFYINIAGRIKR